MSLRWKKDLEARWAAAGALKLGRGSAGLGYAGGCYFCLFSISSNRNKRAKSTEGLEGFEARKKINMIPWRYALFQ